MFHTTQTTGRLYSTAVPSTLACMKNAPSPHTDTHGRSGAASFAPSTPATPKPIGPKPMQPISEFGRCGLQYCSSQLWCTPMSLTMMASSGSARSISKAARCGLIGVESSLKPGAM